MSIKVLESNFLLSLRSPDDDRLVNYTPAIAFVGRSNVGKSSLINRLLSRKNIARTSSTPGCTQLINVYQSQIQYNSSKITPHLIDLPGFGYAKISKSERENVNRMITELLFRTDLNLTVCLLNDCRRSPEADELAVQKICSESGHHLLVVATKVDKLKKAQTRKAIATLASNYGLVSEDLITTGKTTDVALLWDRVLPLVSS